MFSMYREVLFIFMIISLLCLLIEYTKYIRRDLEVDGNLQSHRPRRLVGGYKWREKKILSYGLKTVRVPVGRSLM